MKVVIEQSEMEEAAKELTYQAPFPLKKQCRKCKESMTLMMLIDDNDWEILKQRPEKAKVWPHDCTAVAVYLCTNCGSMRASWNQG